MTPRAVKTVGRIALAVLAVDIALHLAWYWLDLLSSVSAAPKRDGSLPIVYSTLASVTVLNLIYTIALASQGVLTIGRIAIRSLIYFVATVVFLGLAVVILLIAIGSAFPT